MKNFSRRRGGHGVLVRIKNIRVHLRHLWMKRKKGKDHDNAGK